MKTKLGRGAKLFGFAIICLAATHSNATSASVNEAAVQAKREAESKGYVFASSHEEIVARAKTEGKFRALSGLAPEAIKVMVAAFNKTHPFLNVYVEEITGTEAYRRFILEMKSGMTKGWDATFVPLDLYDDYLPHQKKFDLLGMASHGVLKISPQMIDPLHRNTVSASSFVQVVAFSKKLISIEKVPGTWEEFLKSEFKGRKFAVDVRPKDIAALVPAWGLEKTLEFARQVAAQEPVWIRGGTRQLAAMIAGELALFLGPNFSTVKRAQNKDPSGTLGYKMVEPVPVRPFAMADGVLELADHPYAALLWLEFQAGPEGQKIMDQYGPYTGSIFTPGSAVEKETRGKKISAVDWHHVMKLEDYSAQLLKAYGFPQAK